MDLHGERLSRMKLLISMMSVLIFILMFTLGSDCKLIYLDMATTYGGDSCKNCQVISLRQDECDHFYFGECSGGKCVANYMLQASCEPGTGICYGREDSDTTAYVQYLREDSNCSSSNPDWHDWITIYSGSNCTEKTYEIRCDKVGSCDGTLIDSYIQLSGIKCVC